MQQNLNALEINGQYLLVGNINTFETVAGFLADLCMGIYSPPSLNSSSLRGERLLLRFGVFSTLVLLFKSVLEILVLDLILCKSAL